MKNRKKVGIALGSGASRGMAHIGVIEVLKKYDIPIDFVAGSSIGAVIGALYCAGVDLEYFSRLAAHVPTKTILDFSFSKNGLIAGHKIKSIMSLLLRNRTFQDLKTPLCVIATDLVKCERVILNQGSISEALRASISIPGVFAPVKYKDKILVDGGVTDRVPVTVVKEMGADFVIASDVGFNGGNFKIKSFFDVVIRSLGIMEKEAATLKTIHADVVIKPEVEDINPASFEEAEKCVQRGREAAERAVPYILEALNSSL
ncbi:MAG: patatin family protein [Clostridiaceae bacterium]|nr:patatin family protein [Clostridiaceae bacterium]